MIATTEEEIKTLRAAGKILAGVLSDLVKLTKDGISAAELDLAAEHVIRLRGAIPSFLNYKPEGASYPYPATLCVSVNGEVVHGLPHAEKVFHNGDIVSLDLGLSYKGLFVDAARTVIVGSEVRFDLSGERSLMGGAADLKGHTLVAATREALLASIASAKVGGHMGDLGAAVVRTAAKYKLGVVEELGGHAVGHAVHERPFIANDGREGEGEEIVDGMVLAIEPMLAEGKGAIVLDEDDWTYRMKDRKRAAHFEDTVLITKKGAEVLTQ